MTLSEFKVTIILPQHYPENVSACQVQWKNPGRRATYTFVPASSLLVCCCRTGVIAQLDFIQLGKILLVSSRAAEIAFTAVVVNGSVETPCSCLWVVLSVGLYGVIVNVNLFRWVREMHTEGFCERVCLIIRLVQLLALNSCCLLKGFSSLLSCCVSVYKKCDIAVINFMVLKPEVSYPSSASGKHLRRL